MSKLRPESIEALQVVATLCHVSIGVFGKRRGSLRQLEVFLHLANNPEATRSEIASRTGIELAGVYNDLDRLGPKGELQPFAMGFLLSQTDKINGTRFQHQLSARGARAFETLCGAQLSNWGSSVAPSCQRLSQIPGARLGFVDKG